MIVGFVVGLGIGFSLLFLALDEDIGFWTWCAWIGRHRYALTTLAILGLLTFASLLWLLRQHELAQVNCAYSYFGCDIRPPHPTKEAPPMRLVIPYGSPMNPAFIENIQ
jgi:hypothetical protein